MSYLARADEERQRIKDEEPERHAAETARVRAELALCLAIAALRSALQMPRVHDDRRI